MLVQLVARPLDFEEIDDEQAEVGFSQRRNAALQRSQDSGALTDWSGGSRGSPTRQSCRSSSDSLEKEDQKYVTVLTVNGGLDHLPAQGDIIIQLPDFVTILPVEECDQVQGVGGVCLSLAGFIEEVVCIARRQGQKLGFGLKFDGGNEADRPVRRLFVQCCAEGSLASKIRCSWGRLVEADEIIEIDGVDIRNTLSRLQVVSKLKDGQDMLSLKMRHYWEESKRKAIMEQLSNASSSPLSVAECGNNKQPVARKSSVRQRQERAVDVPEELLIQSAMRCAHGGRTDQSVKDDTPPVPPRRKRRTKLLLKGSEEKTTKQPICRSLSSDEVLINGNRVVASGGVERCVTPSKPPRNRTPNQSRSFNDKHNNSNKEGPIKFAAEVAVQAPATLPRTYKEPMMAPEPKRRNTVVMISASNEPQPAEVYINLIAEEDKRLSLDAATESESESSSSVSTVVDSWSVSSSFGDFSEQEECREQATRNGGASETDLFRAGLLRSENLSAGIVAKESDSEPAPPPIPATAPPTTSSSPVCVDVMVIEAPSDPVLSVLIEPPETFLDQDSSSISPSSEGGHQDASSDSGASSGGSELHLGESDEELRVFQQMESALELESDCDAISAPFIEHIVEPLKPASAAAKRTSIPVVKAATAPTRIADVKPAMMTQTKTECRPSEPEPTKSRVSGIAKPRATTQLVECSSPSAKAEQTPPSSSSSNNKNNKVASARPNLNRTPLRSRIPQAVSSPANRATISATVANTSTTTPPTTKSGGVSSSNPSRIARPAVNNKPSGIVAPKVVIRTANNNTGSSNNIAAASAITAAAVQNNNKNNSTRTKVTTPIRATVAAGDNIAKSSPSTLLKSSKSGLVAAVPASATATTTTTTSTTTIQASAATTTSMTTSPNTVTNHIGSKIPRPAQQQLKSSPSAGSARPALTVVARHPSSSSLLPRTGVKPSPLHKSTSRLHLTHNKGESSTAARPDLVSAH